MGGNVPISSGSRSSPHCILPLCAQSADRPRPRRGDHGWDPGSLVRGALGRGPRRPPVQRPVLRRHRRRRRMDPHGCALRDRLPKPAGHDRGRRRPQPTSVRRQAPSSRCSRSSSIPRSTAPPAATTSRSFASAAPMPQPAAPLMTADVEPAYNGLTTGVVAGWGADTPNGSAGVSDLRVAPIPLLADSVCVAVLASFLSENHICAGNSAVGPCPGDSGGPLLVADTRGLTRVAGVVSYGSDPCNQTPAGFAQVSANVAWIQSLIGSAPPPPTPAPPTPAPNPTGAGYWMLGADGKVYPFGAAAGFGEPAGQLDGAAVGIGHRPPTTRATGSSPPPAGSSASAVPPHSARSRAGRSSRESSSPASLRRRRARGTWSSPAAAAPSASATHRRPVT